MVEEQSIRSIVLIENINGKVRVIQEQISFVGKAVEVDEAELKLKGTQPEVALSLAAPFGKESKRDRDAVACWPAASVLEWAATAVQSSVYISRH